MGSQGIRSRDDVLLGIVLATFGATALALTADIPTGSAAAMGPGYVPRLLAWGMIGFGGLIAARGMVRAAPQAAPWALRPLAAILVAILIFMQVERLGLALAVATLVAVACLGDPEARRWESLVLAISLSIFSVLVFAVALKLPFPLWPAILVH